MFRYVYAVEDGNAVMGMVAKMNSVGFYWWLYFEKHGENLMANLWADPPS